MPKDSILGLLLFNVSMNYVYIHGNFFNFADDYFVLRSSPDVNVILSNVLNNRQISLKCFDDSGTKPKPSKFKFMVTSSEYIEPKEFAINDDVYLHFQT